jgi:hypothetical protein
LSPTNNSHLFHNFLNIVFPFGLGSSLRSLSV